MGRRGLCALALGVTLLAAAGCGDVSLPDPGELTASPDAGGADPGEGAGPSAEPGAGPSADAGKAGRLLARLDVRAAGSMDGYSRDRFPHWSERGDSCDTRELVLRRDGDGVRTDDECQAVDGRWRSPYDDGTWSEPGDVDIDHVVPLANAWRSGANRWPDERREAFANDTDRPQLLTVTDNVNQSKGDQGPEEWKPPNRGFWCAYATDWIVVKDHYALTVTRAESSALREMLTTC